MFRFATLRNATALMIAGALLWLVRLPAFELDLMTDMHGTSRIDVVSLTLSLVAIIGLAAIAAGTAVDAVAGRSRASAVATVAMVAGLVGLAALGFVPNDSLPIQTAGLLGFAAAFALVGVARGSIAGAVAAVSMAVHAVSLLPGNPFDTAYLVRELAPAVFGVAVVLFAGGRALERSARETSARSAATLDPA